MNQEQNSTKKIWLLTFYLFLDPEDDETLTDKTRDLGLVVVRCTSLLTISPVDGSEIIDNPFIQPEQ